MFWVKLLYSMFNAFGFVIVLLTSIIITLVLLWIFTRSEYNRLKKIIIIAVCFVVVQVGAFFLLLYDFPKASTVDISPLEAIGEAYITDFNSKQLPLEESISFISKNRQAYNYRFRNVNTPSLELTAYPMKNTEVAMENLLIAAGIEPGVPEQLSETVYIYRPDSVYLREQSTFFTQELDRYAETFIIIDDVLFVFRETGNRDRIGETSSRVIAMICDILVD